MKKLKKCMALLLAAIMVLAMSVTTFAAIPAAGKLTVETNKGQSLKGQKIYVFKLFDYTSKDTEAGTHEYEVNNIYAKALGEVLGTEKTDSYALYSALVTKTKPEEIAEFANAFADKVISKGAILGTLDTDYKVSADTEGNTYTFENLDAGYYLVYPAVTEVFQASLVNVDGATSVKLKAEAPVPNKEAVDNGGKPVENVQVGDILTYKVTTKVPDASAYAESSYKFNLKDTLSEGLDFVNGGNVVASGTMPVSVTVAGEADQTVEAKVDGRTMTVELGKIVLANQTKIGSDIVVKYQAKVNEDATIENTENSATLEYSNKPGTDETGESVPDVVKTPTFAVKVHKYEAGKDKDYLAGAVFTLSKNENGSEPISVVPVKGKDGYYKVAENQTGTEEDAKVTTVSTVVGEGYNLCIEGLKAGTYYLTEVQAPKGFNKTDTVKFTIEDKTKEGAEPSFQIKDKEGKEVTGNILKIENRKGSMLPSTGGMGTVIFTVVGAVLLGGIAISFVVSRKRKAE